MKGLRTSLATTLELTLPTTALAGAQIVDGEGPEARAAQGEDADLKAIEAEVLQDPFTMRKGEAEATYRRLPLG